MKIRTIALFAVCLSALASAQSTPSKLDALAFKPIEFQAPPPPPPTTSFEGIYGGKNFVAGVVTHHVTSLHRIFGIKGFDLEGRGFGGVNFGQQNSPVIGGLAALHIPVSQEAQGEIGFGLAAQQKGKLRGVLYGGITLPWNN